MSRPFNILIVDDSESDAELVLRTLRRDGIDARTERVHSPAAMAAALRRQSWDAVISDYNMPSFTALDALRVFRESGLDLPFVLVSGAVGEETAVAAMKAGANDYVMKNNLGRLAPALKRELQDAANRAAQRAAERGLAENEARFRSLTALSSDWYWEQDTEYRFSNFSGGGQHGGWGPDQGRTLGLRRWELPGVTPAEGSWDQHKALLEAREPFRNFEYLRKHSNGALQHISASGEPVFDASGRFTGYCGVATDITESKRAGQALIDSEDRFRSLSSLSSDWSWNTDTEHRFIDTPARVTAITGLTKNAYVGLRRWEVEGLRPESGDWSAHRQVLERRETYRDLVLVQTRPDGTLCYLQINGEPVYDAAGSFTGYRGTAKDISERKHSDAELRRFRLAMDSSGDGISLMDRATLRYLDVNQSLCEMLGYSRQELLGMTPMDVTGISRELLERDYDAIIADKENSANRFEGEYLRKDGSLIPVEARRRAFQSDGGWIIVGTSRDITERNLANERIRRLNRVYAVLSGVNALIVRARDREELFREACRIAVEAGKFRGAWLGIVDREAQRVKPVASRGVDDAYLRAIPLGHLDGESTEPVDKMGMTRLVVIGREALYSSDMTTDPRVLLKKEARARGFRSHAVVPLLVAGEAIGVLSLYAAETDFFDEEERKLLNQLAGDIAFAIDKLDQAERLQIEAAERLHAEDKVRRLNRVYAVLSGINAAIVRVTTKEDLFREACRIAGSAGGFPVAWIGEVDRDTMLVRPVAGHNAEHIFLGLVRMTIAEGLPDGIGVVGQAVRDRAPVISNDIMQDSRILVKRSAEGDTRSLAVLPLVVGDEVRGVLVLHTETVGFFDEAEVKLLRGLAADIGFALDHIEKADRLDYLAYYDALTGLANRTLFHERLSQYANIARQGGGKLAMVLLDVERFKTINDSLGRQAGDELLRLVAARLGQEIDAGSIARIGADHFAIVLPDVKGRSEVVRTVERIWRGCFAQSFVVNGTELRIAAKSGIALYPTDGANAEVLHANAESALRRAQRTGERHLFHTADLTVGSANQFTLENQLRLALEKEEFVLHYQPKLDSETRRIVGVEALIRWQSPELGLVPPMKFIPLMEETGLILEVGAWALKRATLDHRNWVKQGLQAPRVAVNVSAIQLRQRDFVASVEQAIIEGVAPTGIDLELTESLVMADVQGNIDKLQAVRKLGVQIAIDDFGTGYSSLAYLARLPVQALKIDRSFIITMLNNADTMTLVQTIISLAHSLRLKVIAEGVDAEEQAKMLRLLRCDEMQGFLFSKPVPFEQMSMLLQKGMAVSP